MNASPIAIPPHGHISLIDHMGDDLAIARAARVSSDGYQGEISGPRWSENAIENLLRYMMENGHTSPFEMVEFKFLIKCPIFIARQWMRHRMWSYNEMSGRYTELPSNEFWWPMITRAQNQTGNKQGSHDDSRLWPLTEYIQGSGITLSHLYEMLIERGMAREQARTVLSLGQYTTFIGKVDLNNLIKFLSLRDHEHAQPEIREYAIAIDRLIRPIVPITMGIYDDVIKNSVRLTKNQVDILREYFDRVKHQSVFDAGYGKIFKKLGVNR